MKTNAQPEFRQCRVLTIYKCNSRISTTPTSTIVLRPGQELNPWRDLDVSSFSIFHDKEGSSRPIVDNCLYNSLSLFLFPLFQYLHLNELLSTFISISISFLIFLNIDTISYDLKASISLNLFILYILALSLFDPIQIFIVRVSG